MRGWGKSLVGLGARRGVSSCPCTVLLNASVVRGGPRVSLLKAPCCAFTKSPATPASCRPQGASSIEGRAHGGFYAYSARIRVEYKFVLQQSWRTRMPEEQSCTAARCVRYSHGHGYSARMHATIRANMAWRERVIDRSNHLLLREQNGVRTWLSRKHMLWQSRRRRAMGVLTAK